ncbi:AT-hook motif nuclear-localized protein 26 [Spatholobus suberectus]|nr:AT-hook motif nuclear-localized protein 26 [Spatholobus suberectus]
MDPITTHEHYLPPPFHTTRDLHLHHQHQFHALQQSTEDEQSESSGGLNLAQKRDREENNNNNNNNSEVKEGAVFGETKITRRPHERPSESKNKPKPPIIITHDSANVLKTHVIKVADSCDIIDSVSSFTRRRQRGVCIMSGTGTITKTSGIVVTLHGRFEILSLTGSFMPPRAASGLTIYLAGG